MDEDGLPIVGSGVDLTKVPAIQQKRMVAFLNQFIVHTVRFLNRFSTVCEEKLAAVSLRIQQIETTLSVLEAKVCAARLFCCSPHPISLVHQCVVTRIITSLKLL
ncbi:WASH complex subunit CCDC53 isoform X1 [Arapaima gigas]